ncbi:DUF4238 domain-containing protein [Candidatus Bathyarchaeota archaeon]|nr:DUF4238 domain-containing protein [Candidatus Bathyarchaeota archaeon]
MSGIRHHFQPKFLLKGFSSKMVGNKCFCWVYGKNVDPSERNIINIGVQNKFYDNGNSAIDDAITKEENNFALTINKLRCFKNNKIVNSNEISPIIAHLEIRTRHLREAFLDLSNVLFTEIINFFKNPENFDRFIQMTFNKAIIKEFTKRHIPIKHRAQYRSSFKKTMLPQIENQFKEYLNIHSNKLFVDMPDIVKKGHLKGLDKTVIPKMRIDKYSKLIWRLFYSINHYILGDFGILIEIDSPKKYTTFWTSDFELEKIYLPISKNHLLVGSKSKNEKIIDSSDLNKVIAEHALDYFISSEKRPELSSLAKLIGDKSQIFTENEIMELCGKSFHI